MQDVYKVEKALNNNVVICSTDDKEVVFIGRGIGFGKKTGDTFESTSYDKVYALVNEEEQQQYSRLALKETEETMLLIHESMEMIHELIGMTLNERTLTALTQHIVLALQRTRDETEIQNPFLTETKWLYHDTYQIAERVVAYIERETKVRLPEAEIGFITLHIQSALGHPDRYAPDLITRCVHYSEEKLNVRFVRQSTGFRRYVQHLRTLAELPAAISDTKTEEEMLFLLKENYPLCYTVSRNVIRMMEKASGAPSSKRDVIQTILFLIHAKEEAAAQ
ncbi:PRD domain-containing protein [Alkalicoccus urumqiensis]|uniref:PRD domain-containing protein n=1 Tax=Alkalicoccus urumqiensis TaxID=1548213 RepID=A0A2P6MF80_ALKUR|nr:PRD domain-containing protein [Alkalicoccus urumqiensis]PRO64936.1 hypothetical protein C6I21_12395 [Alkalicoccus urumqiensis]